MDDNDHDNGLEETNEIPTQTQADVTGMITAIFGDDSDDDDIKATNKYKFLDDDDDDGGNLLDNDSDDDYQQKRQRLSKSGTSAKTAQTKSKLSKLTLQKEKKKPIQKSDKIKKKKKLFREGSEKRKSTTSDNITAKTGEEHISGDEYDSGSEVEATEDDRRFIDTNDEFADLVREYEEDDQDFDDERPDSGRGGSSKSKKFSKNSRSSAGGGEGGGGSRDPKTMDPMSLTLLSMKKIKVIEMAENDKAKIATDLMTKMDVACRKDEECVLKGEPAIHKLALLPVVQQIVNMKHMQLTLLEYDMLNVLKDWIEPRDSKTLTSHAVRSAVYDVLLKLPCQVDHLKRAAPGKQPIGATIVALRKHASETIENKKLLREIMEKWCRPVFDKSVDPRRMASGRENTELKELIAQREREREVALRQQMLANCGSSSPRTGTIATTNKFTDILDGRSDLNKPKDAFNRVRTPYSSGFLFTIQPDTVQSASLQRQIGVDGALDSTGRSSGSVIVPRQKEDALGEGRQRLLKIMKESGGVGARGRNGAGKVTNPRAVTLTLSGRNKA